MNALPIKPTTSPAEVIDSLIADHGIRRVVLAIATRLVRTPKASKLDPPSVDGLSDHLRRDMGLGPAQQTHLRVTYMAVMNRHIL